MFEEEYVWENYAKGLMLVFSWGDSIGKDEWNKIFSFEASFSEKRVKEGKQN